MKKNNLMSCIVISILFILFNVIAFVIPSNKTSTFWTAYAFSVVAFATQIPLCKIVFNRNDTLKSKFFRIPIIYVGIIYLIIQLITFAIFKFISTLPVWLAVVVCAIVLSISAICMIVGEIGASEINLIEEKIKVKRTFIQLLQIDIEMLVNAEKDNKTKEVLKKLVEMVRFSDPISHEMLSELETKIITIVEKMKNASNKIEFAREVEVLLIERNKKCKILK